MAPVAASAGLPLVARPNAGGPTQVGGRFVYPATPDYVAEVARDLLAEGVAIVGGCCGTGPAHTAAIAAALADRAARARPLHRRRRHGGRRTSSAAGSGADRARARRSGRGELVVTVEMEPPRSFNAAQLVAAAHTLRDAGATAIDVADSPMAKMRMSAWAACRLVQEQVGIETVLHFPTRGRNVLRLQGDLLGAHALGIRNLFVCVGDPVTIGDYPHGSNDVDVTATGLLQLITEHFNAGVDRAGSSIGEPTSFFAGAAVAPAAPDLEREVRLLAKKVAAGAGFLLTQPVYGVGPLRALREAYERHHGRAAGDPDPRGRASAGVGAPRDVPAQRGAGHRDPRGRSRPDGCRRRGPCTSVGDRPGDGGRARRTLAGEGVAGVYVMPQFGRYDRAAETIEAVRAAWA